ncbi:MAG: leucine-rich repeat domain-containing protein [Clostridia bacterium]|nr:leucine-rich repeat domain-containing protein [Clostridia bacterium]
MLKMNFLGDRNPSEARKEQKDAAIRFAAALDAIDVESVKTFQGIVTKLKSKPDIEVHHVKPSGDKKGKILSASGIAITGLMKFLVEANTSELGPLGSPEREELYNKLCILFGPACGKGGRVNPVLIYSYFRAVESGSVGLSNYLEKVYNTRYRGVEVHEKDKHNEYTWVSGPFVHMKPCEAMAAFLKKIYDKFVIGDNSDLVCTYDPEKVKFYQDNSKLVKMTVNDGIKAIVDASFYGCTGLKSVDLPDSLQTIGENAFRGCTLIKSIEIPKNVTSIGKGAFCGCYTMESITIPEGITRIENIAFGNCWKLKSITIPQSVTSIEAYAFGDCRNLKSITIPPSVTSIKEGAFEECIKLKSITIPDSVKSIERYAFLSIDPSATINGIPYLEWLEEFKDKH